ncbi:MAG: hypothetical protein IK152_06700 [Lachnospiraceae bacterium]|nr:hypothetical protein [Lachnospiraceae bacterium]
MAIFLTILKVIGIILLCILGLILLILLLALFSPLTYNVYVTGTKDIKKLAVKAKFGWFLYIIRPVVVFENNELSVKVRIFGIPIKVGKKTESTESDEDRGRFAVPMEEEIKEGTEPGGGGQRTVPVYSVTEEEPPLIEDKSIEGKATESSFAEEDEEINESVTSDSSEESTDKKKTGFSDKIKSIFKKDKNKKKLTKEEKARFKEEKARLKAEKKEESRKKREETKKKVEDSIAKAKKVRAYLKEEETKKAIALAKDVLKKTLKHILPRRFKGHINLGMEDPSTTGTILAACGAAYPVHKGNFLITPIFETEELVIDGEARVKGHVFLIFFVIQGLRILTNKRIMSIIKKARK